jgi:hypothetical protein
MQPKKFNIIFDIKKGLKSNENIELVTGDYGTNVLDVKIENEYGQNYDLTSVIPRLVVKTPSGSTLQRDMVVTNPIAGLCEINVPQEMFTEVGTHYAEIQIWDEATNIIRATLKKFHYTVRGSLMDEGTVVADNDYNLLQTLVDEVNQALGEADNLEETYAPRLTALEQDKDTTYQQITTQNSVVSLPSTAKRGFLDFIFEGRTLINQLVYNKDTWAEWTKSASGVTASATGIKITADGSGLKYISLNTNMKPNTKYGYLFNVTNNTITTGSNVILTSYQSINSIGMQLGNKTGHQKFIDISVSTIINNRVRFEVNASTPSGQHIELKDIRVYELPTGSQIETDFNTLTADQLAIKYPFASGMQSAKVPQVRSVGKNLFDGKVEIGNISSTTGEVVASANNFRSSNFIRISQSQHSITIPNSLRVSSIKCYDENKLFIGNATIGTTGGVFTPLANTEYVKFNGYRADSQNITNEDLNNLTSMVQIEKGNITTSYEPYTETTYTLPQPLELRSLPNGIKDTFDTKSGKVTRNVSNVVDLSTLPWAKLSTETANYYIVNTPISDSVYYANLANATFFLIHNYPSVANVTNSWSNFISLDDFSVFVDANKYYSTKIPKTELTSTTNTAIQNWFATRGAKLIYQLAQPIVTDIDVPPIPNYPSGTVFFEDTDIVPNATVTYPVSTGAVIQTQNQSIVTLSEFMSKQNAINLEFDLRLTAIE